MNVLITHQFNSKMQSLSSQLKNEVVSLFNYASNTTKEDITKSPFVTIIASKNNDIFTIRGSSIRIFCSFSDSESDDLFFLDVSEIGENEPNLQNKKSLQDTSLLDGNGKPVAYISDKEEKIIYLFNGYPVAYIDDSNNIYGFNGKHLGWFEDGIVWDHSGHRAGFIKETYNGYAGYEPFKNFKQFKPYKSYKQYAPYKPYKLFSNSKFLLENLLQQGR